MKFLKVLPLFIFGAVFVLSACNEEDRTAEVYGNVYWAETHLVPNASDTTKEDTIIYLNPAPDVEVYLEQDKSSDMPYTGEDLYTTTDNNGQYSFVVYLGRSFDENSMMFKEQRMADVRLYFQWTPHGNYTLYNGGTAYIAGQLATEVTGLTIKDGERIKAPDVVVGAVYFRP